MRKRPIFQAIHIRKKWYTAALCLCFAAVFFYVVNYPPVVGAASTTRQLPIYCVQRDQKLVSISFDAAWGDVRVRHNRRGVCNGSYDKNMVS